MNIYKLPVNAYNRTHERTISEDAIKDKLVGQKQKRKIGMETDERCKECKKDWTKCGTCPVMMEWVKEHKNE